ncbi:MAG TPA: HAD-IA family hydrolase [Steroidobacteraceae bacterium]|nr:HAD-IA family hydrolase [Steroidobacteraceae bacterium]
MSTPIQSIVFDVGWVLVTLDYSPLTTYLQEHGALIGSMRDVTSRIGLEKHETGALAGEQFLENLARLGDRPMDRDELRARWVNMFAPQEAMLALARALAERYRVHLLSNVGDLHWDHLTRSFGLDRLGHGTLPSYLAGYMKPNPAIYAEAERRFGLSPSTTVFIDDLPDNVAAARGRGWHGIEHKSHALTVRALGTLGVTT